MVWFVGSIKTSTVEDCCFVGLDRRDKDFCRGKLLLWRFLERL